MSSLDERKWLGVRRIRGWTTDQEVDQEAIFFKEGLHPVISHLIDHNPGVLGKVLSTLSPLQSSIYISRLLSTSSVRTPTQHDNSVRQTFACRTLRSSKRKLRSEKIYPRRLSTSSSLISRKRKREEDRVGSMEDIIVTEDDRFFAKTVIEDEIQLSIEAAGDLIMECNIVPRDLLCAVSKDSGEPNMKDSKSLLNWLGMEIEKDWVSFVGTQDFDSTSYIQTKLDFSDDSDCGSLRDEDTIDVYKASMRLGGRVHCDLGTYKTAKEAANAYNRGVIARRTIGMKLYEGISFVKMAKSREADYKEMRRLVLEDVMSPHESQKYARAAAIRVNEKPKPDKFFTSNTVLFPELNSDYMYAFEKSSFDNLYRTPEKSSPNVGNGVEKLRNCESVVGQILSDVIESTLNYNQMTTQNECSNGNDTTEIENRIRFLEGNLWSLSHKIVSTTETLADEIARSEASPTKSGWRKTE